MGLEKLFDGNIYGITCFEHSLGRSNEYVVREMLETGVRIIQYREKYRSKRIKYEECLLLRKITKDYNALFIVNDDIDLAVLSKADGIHLGQDDLPLKEARKLKNKKQFIGISTHSPQQAREAVKAGADYIGAGPVFATATKEGICRPVGLESIKYVSNNIKVPFVAIGGIKEHNMDEVLKAGASCLSLVTEITAAKNIPGKIKNILKHLHETILLNLHD